MFTGIIEEMGTLIAQRQRGAITTLTIAAKTVIEHLNIGDSIATNGVCLTVTEFTHTQFCAELMPETMKKTNFSTITIGNTLNLERALKLDSRLDGHMVSGHIDTTAKLSQSKALGGSHELTFMFNKAHQGLVIEKGSIAINGISLTVIRETDKSVTVGIIPHTYAHTNLHQLNSGALVNIEFDQQGKYILRQLQALHLNFDQLAQWGY